MMIDSKYITKSTILFHYRKKYVILHMAKIKIYDFFLNHFFIKCQISKLSEGRQNVTFHFPASHYKIKTFKTV